MEEAGGLTLSASFSALGRNLLPPPPPAAAVAGPEMYERLTLARSVQLKQFEITVQD